MSIISISLSLNVLKLSQLSRLEKERKKKMNGTESAGR